MPASSPPGRLRFSTRLRFALDAAHAKGLVHRDVKPANILIGDSGERGEGAVYLSDFGLTKGQSDARELSRTDEIVGTLDYAAPEQIESGEVGAATDVYALGCVLYQCLVGQVPYPRETKMQLLWAHLEEPPPAPSERNPELPHGIDAVIARAMAKEAERRFASCGEFIAAAWLALGSDGDTAELARRARRALPAVEARNPYKGLRAFGEADADDFFGREALTDELLERIGSPERGRLIAVVGPSGSGKSSVVKAGLLPLLRRGTVPGSARWLIAEFVPGARPVEELGGGALAALAGAIGAGARRATRAARRARVRGGAAAGSGRRPRHRSVRGAVHARRR